MVQLGFHLHLVVLHCGNLGEQQIQTFIELLPMLIIDDVHDLQLVDTS